MIKNAFNKYVIDWNFECREFRIQNTTTIYLKKKIEHISRKDLNSFILEIVNDEKITIVFITNITYMGKRK